MSVLVGWERPSQDDGGDLLSGGSAAWVQTGRSGASTAHTVEGMSVTGRGSIAEKGKGSVEDAARAPQATPLPPPSTAPARPTISTRDSTSRASVSKPKTSPSSPSRYAPTLYGPVMCVKRTTQRVVSVPAHRAASPTQFTITGSGTSTAINTGSLVSAYLDSPPTNPNRTHKKLNKRTCAWGPPVYSCVIDTPNPSRHTHQIITTIVSQ